ncbi:hypothetical protein [Candidatus Solincola tengchongensis]|uniref:hypothetical protein n=1 Tax=Candidatus Solincola tengchongensis TaxID=2900693 RepID=UPI00257AA9AE|nr:hypothetical protein [Candidatus Solincola tengchongensis]
MAEERDEIRDKGIASESAGTPGEEKDAVFSSDPGREEAENPGESAGQAGKKGRATTKDGGSAGGGTERRTRKAASSSRGGETATETPEGRETHSEEKVGEESGAASRSGEAKREKVSEEEFRRLVEESLERVTVEEVTLTVMNQFASLGYLKMGLPESVNLKYRDLSQALLAIDLLEAMIKGAEGKIPEESLKPFRGTLANLQLNYVQLKKRLG